MSHDNNHSKLTFELLASPAAVTLDVTILVLRRGGVVVVVTVLRRGGVVVVVTTLRRGGVVVVVSVVVVVFLVTDLDLVRGGLGGDRSSSLAATWQ